MRSACIPIADGALFARLTGETGGAPKGAVLFLHGWTLDSRMWGPQLSSLPPEFLGIAIDRRGFGRSTAPPDLTLETEDIEHALDHLGLERAVIVGMSQSGRIAANFALSHADRVAGLVLQGARLGVAVQEPRGEDIPIARFSELARSERLAEMKSEWRAHSLMRLRTDAARTMIDEILADYDGRDLIRTGAPAPEIDVDMLARISAPTLIIDGAEDTPLRRKIADELSRIIPGAKRAEIANAGHLCNVEAAAEYNAVLIGFLNEIFRSAGQIA